jgi:hypothetical protein
MTRKSESCIWYAFSWMYDIVDGNILPAAWANINPWRNFVDSPSRITIVCSVCLTGGQEIVCIVFDLRPCNRIGSDWSLSLVSMQLFSYTRDHIFHIGLQVSVINCAYHYGVRWMARWAQVFSPTISDFLADECMPYLADYEAAPKHLKVCLLPTLK